MLGLNNFAQVAAVPAMRRAPLAKLHALGSRSLAKAERAAAALNGVRAYGSYEQLLADPELEAVFISLPNSLHVPWSIAAARAGKHVLCEKPLALSRAEAESLADVARETGKLVAEGFMLRYHPQWLAVVDLIRSGRIGEVRAVQTAFSYCNTDLEDIRNRPDSGGGALFDIGCYAVNTARLIFGREPERVIGVAERDPRTTCDRLTSAILDFGVGQASFVVGTQHVPYQRVHVFGTRGHLELEIPFNAPHDRPCPVYVDEGFVGAPDFTVRQSSDERAELITTPAANQFTQQWQAMSAAIRSGGTLPNDMQSAIANARIIDAIVRSTNSDRWEKP
ncbi:MAG TPA: Gfo/Idh/MocA family oxidoreductase [Polyangiaceae bacterium]|nr:Gfo/Idh/MocA family oxidoreductase [Polyangiaceae bacterium]